MRQNAMAVRLFVESGQFNPEGLSYMDCPECGGKGKMVIGFHDDGCAWYKCLRARCQASGVVGKGHYQAPQQRRQKPLDPIPYLDPRQRKAHLDTLPEALWERRQVEMDEGWCERVCEGYAGGRFVFPIKDGVGVRAGTILRAFDREPKAFTLRHVQDVPLLAWYNAANLMSQACRILIVEDQLSAARIHPNWGIVSIALLGTHLSPDAAQSINRMNPLHKPVYISLDNDATDKAVGMRRQLHNARVLPLVGPDIKDMSDKQLFDFLKGV